MRKTATALSATLLLSASPAAAALSSTSASGGPFTIEYYYKVKWGHLDEWIELYERNHFPVIASEMKQGFIVGYKIEQPRSYWPEPHRWDVRVSITWRDALVAHGMVDKKRDVTLARLYHDKAKHTQEEQRRFQLLEGLWEVELESMKIKGWPPADRK
jgi:hypothetical protein